MLKLGDYNVFIVDWTEYNGFPYEQAVANTRVIGAIVAKMIKFLIKEAGISPESVHLIGHSLGAHTAGYAGERIPNLGRITGLDPAGPYFQSVGPEVRLDPTDALFVDAIHTDGAEIIIRGLGMNDAVGHMDFYPNGGQLQLGCVHTSQSGSGAVGAMTNTENSFIVDSPLSTFGECPIALFGIPHKIEQNFSFIFTAFFIFNGCDHERANEFFMESVNHENAFQSVLCDSYSDYENGKCKDSSVTAQMGFHAKKIPGLKFPAKFYLRTRGDTPFSF
ncbi:inactive pancreatic lipase-related protein 1 [Caerostris darwini]|uniref:Inactive pancreatic lipase-related protein 1 n=1 Tax=Caerostris darwini TaxID=1538125 RepID=A0AAV4SWB5_9ARAC|nr:inactive pancreatic lipase-related protein 1 [Caerostris darwini]